MAYFLEALHGALALILSFDPEIWFIVWTSIRVSIVAVILASLAGIPLGLLVALKEFRGKALLTQVLDTLMALPTVVVGLFLYGMFTRHGPLGGLEILYTPWAIILGESVLILPIVWNLTLTAIRSTDPRLLLTCRALGATWAQQSRIILSEARVAVMAAVVMGFGRAIGEVGVAMMLGGNIEGYTRTMTTAIALETSKGEFELGLALGLVLLAVAFIVNGFLQGLKRRAA